MCRQACEALAFADKVTWWSVTWDVIIGPITVGFGLYGKSMLCCQMLLKREL